MQHPGTDANQSAQTRQGLFQIVSLLFVWAIVVAASFYSYSPIQPEPRDIDAASFSAERAKPILETLVGDNIPHPSGSDQIAVVRKRIVDMLRSWGYDVEVQSNRSVEGSDVAADIDSIDSPEVFNLIAIKRGKNVASSSQAVMLIAHYDSVPSGPGASDDGVGVAVVLEIARMLSTEPEPERDIVFLITDGEERGLIGARHFVDTHPLANQVGLMINIEARGTSGPSIMFETSHNSRKLMPVFADAARKPIASSMFFEIYRRMPNYSDFSALRKKGILGFNFAFIGDVRNYHSTEDSFENVDYGSLQHHGDNMLGILRASLANEALLKSIDDLTGHPEAEQILRENEAVYFDFFGLGVIWWPMNWTPFIVCGVFCLGILAIGMRWQKRDREVEPGSMLYLLVPIFLLPVCACLTGLLVWGIQQLIQLNPDTASPWPREPFSIGLSLWLAALTAISWLSVSLHSWLKPVATWSAAIVIGLLLAASSSYFVPGISYLFIVPTGLAIVASFVVLLLSRSRNTFPNWLLPACVALFWLPLDRIFYDAVGFGMWPLIVGRTMIVASATLCVLATMTRGSKNVFATSMTIGSIAALLAVVMLNLNS